MLIGGRVDQVQHLGNASTQPARPQVEQSAIEQKVLISTQASQEAILLTRAVPNSSPQGVRRGLRSVECD